MFRRLVSLTGAAVLATAALPALTATAAHTAATTHHVIVFGTDGTRWDKLQQADAPTLKSLIASGYASRTWLYAEPMAPTVSGPGWATNLTGVWPDKHKVLDNGFGGNNLATYHDFLSRAEETKPSLKTYAAVDWKPIGTTILGSAIDKKETLDGDTDGYPVDDAKIATDASSYIKANGPDASFVYFGNVDEAGHEHGGASQQYLAAIATMDRQIGQVIAAVKARPTYSQETWDFIVTTDHGHTDAGGHGGNSWQERQSFVIANGAHQTPSVKPRNVDVARTALADLGITPQASWGLDGVPIRTASTDPFDTLTLKSRVDETGIPADVLGWTHATPAGWKIDNTGMGTGGVTEWQGWSFTDDDFWTRTDPGQGREANVRARGVFAVADSDEWSDKARTGTFNSALVSPAYSVAGKSSATLSFVSDYQKDGNETAQVLVSFDGGADKQVLTYTGDAIAKTERLSIPVPSGAQKMTVKWKLSNGDNNWFWAVDQPSVS